MIGRKHARLLIALALLALSALAIVGCATPSTSGTTGATPSPNGATTGGASSGGAAGGASTIVEANFKFSPQTLNVSVGDTVTFENKDNVAHHVFVGTTDLGEQQPNQNVTWTADTNGTFAVKCSIHPSMTAQITVGGPGSSSGTGTPSTGGGSSTTAPPAGGSSGYGY